MLLMYQKTAKINLIDIGSQNQLAVKQGNTIFTLLQFRAILVLPPQTENLHPDDQNCPKSVRMGQQN